MSKKDISPRVQLLREQHRIFDIAGGYTGTGDGFTCANTCNWLVFVSIYDSLLKAGGPEAFIEQARQSEFSLAEFTAANFSGFRNLETYLEFDALARAFFASFSQNRNLPLPNDGYVEEFIYAVDKEIEIWEKTNED